MVRKIVDIDTENTSPTIGCVPEVLIRQNDEDIALWDVGGNFKHSRSLYYKDIDALMLVYDTTKPKTYYDLVKWLLEVYTCSERTKVEFLRSCPTLIVGTKVDLAPKKDQPTKLQQDWNVSAVYFGKTHTTDQIRDTLRSFWCSDKRTHRGSSDAIRRRRTSHTPTAAY